jgi:uncharacterized protein DUF6252
MKQSLVLFFLIIVMALSSCSDDDGGKDLTVLKMSCSIDGLAWGTPATSAIENVETGTITISGVSGEGAITLVVKADGTKGGAAGEAHYFEYDGLGGFIATYATDDGLTYTINKASNKELEGTFSFSGVNPADQTIKAITNGKFNVNVVGGTF